MSPSFTIQNEAPSNAPMELLLIADPSEEMINRYIPDSEVFVVKDGSETAGVIVIKVEGIQAEIMNVAVDENHQGKGTGSALIQHAIGFAKSSGIEKLIIGTADTSTSQLRLYQKLGFQICHRKQNFFIDHYNEPIYENGVQAKDMIQLEMIVS